MSQKLLGSDLFRVTTTPIAELGQAISDIVGGEGVLTINEFLHPRTVGEGGGYGFKTTRRVFDPHGEYRYVRGGTGGLAAGNAAIAEVAAADVLVPHQLIHSGGANAVVEGVPMVAIPAGSFGWIQTKGKHFDVNIADAVADDAWLDTAAAGAFAVAAALSDAQLQSWLTGCVLRKIADASSLFPGTVNRGICMIRS
jgi:hypothetical protein